MNPPHPLSFVPRALGALLAGCALAALAAVPAGAASNNVRSTHVLRAALPAGKISHILVIELENEGYAATFGPGSPATYLNGTLRAKGALLQNYFATGHVSLDNYIAQVSGQAATSETSSDCLANAFAFANLTPGTPDPNQSANPGQVDGHGCVYPAGVPTIASQLDAKYPPNPKTHVAAWRAYEQDMGNTPSRDGGAPDPTGGTDCGHPSIGASTAVVATAADQYATRHNPFVWFHSVIDKTAECNVNDVPLGTLGANGKPAPNGHLAKDLHNEQTTPRFGFVTPNLCNDGHDATCAGPDSAGGHTGGLAGADAFLQAWMPLVFNAPAYRDGHLLVVLTFDESELGGPGSAAACCGQVPGPNSTAAAGTGGGQIGALLLNAKYITPGTTDTTGSYNHYSALRSYEDLLGLTTGGADGLGHLGYAAAASLTSFGRDVFPASRSGSR